MTHIPLPVILHLGQDDPKKCTSRKMARFKLARLTDKQAGLPYGALLLDPFSDTALSKEDLPLFRKKGITAIDCSWARAEEVFPVVRKTHRPVPRALPLLMAANPTKFGRVGELSTLEALAASYFILGFEEEGSSLLSLYNWGIRFLEVNREPIQAYSRCETSSRIVEVQKEFF